MYRIGIIGAGYTAAELLRLMALHEEMEPVYVSSTGRDERPVGELYPNLLAYRDLLCRPTDLEVIEQNCDAVFLAMPHGQSVPLVKELCRAGIKCVDLGADFRLKDSNLYPQYYDMRHTAPELLEEAVYGIPELYRAEIRNASIVANPGCFPTSAIIPLEPLLRAGVIESQGIVIDSKSGVSGAGKGLSASSHFCSVNEGIHAYKVGTHRHTPEMVQELSRAAGAQVSLTFVPHLVPMNRGMLSTCYCRLKPGARAAQVRELLEEKYADEFFVQILPEGEFPHTKWVYGSNYIQIGIYADDATQNVILISALDNLCKGASGQALQNMNLMLGLEESKGLKSLGVNP